PRTAGPAAASRFELPRRTRRTEWLPRAARLQEGRASFRNGIERTRGRDTIVSTSSVPTAFELDAWRSYVRCNIRNSEHIMATSSDPTVIPSIARTPVGSRQGALAGASATDRVA